MYYTQGVASVTLSGANMSQPILAEHTGTTRLGVSFPVDWYTILYFDSRGDRVQFSTTLAFGTGVDFWPFRELEKLGETAMCEQE